MDNPVRIKWRLFHTLEQCPLSSTNGQGEYDSDTACHWLQGPAYEQPTRLPIHANKKTKKQLFINTQ